jgi:hypothetical protein
MKDLNINQFYNLVKEDYNSFKKIIYNNGLTSKTKNLMFDLVTKCPNQKASELSKTFSELGINSKQEFILILDQIRQILKVSFGDRYIWKDIILQDEWFYKFQKQVDSKRSFVYMYRQAPHLETFYTTIRNAIAHGHFFIKDNFITLWNVSNKNQIKGLMHMNISRFNRLIKSLNNLYESAI